MGTTFLPFSEWWVHAFEEELCHSGISTPRMHPLCAPRRPYIIRAWELGREQTSCSKKAKLKRKGILSHVCICNVELNITYIDKYLTGVNTCSVRGLSAYISLIYSFSLRSVVFNCRTILGGLRVPGRQHLDWIEHPAGCTLHLPLMPAMADSLH